MDGQWDAVKVIDGVLKRSGATYDDIQVIDDELSKAPQSQVVKYGSIEQGVEYVAARVRDRLGKMKPKPAEDRATARG
jgi:hypothetical protein